MNSPSSRQPLLALRPRREIGAVRRAVDISVVLVVAPVVVPTLFVLAALVKLDSPGPAFYGHDRVGTGGRRFRMWKLRTMVTGAAAMKDDLAAQNMLAWPDFKVAVDPRVTRMGRWLRMTSLDELPQLWHILRGDMTLVGPRACSIATGDYALWQTERLEHRPGLFGAWQAHHRATTSFDERCRIEIRERREPSMMRDLVVSAQSFLAVARRNGAV